MGEDEFKKLFSEDELQALQAAADDVEAQVAAEMPKKDGIWYVHDEGSNSLYAVNVAGKTILWITVNNDVELTAEQIGGHLPFGVTAHRIVVWNSYRSASVETKGFAVLHLHDDGTGAHIDGNTVRMYVMPRMSRWLAHFYGV